MSAVGATIGSYRVVRELGRGAMGVVYVAHDPGVGREVALKVLLGSEARQLERFEREVEAAGALLHPHLVRVYAAGTHQGRPYYVMELVEGESLADALGRGPLPVDAARELFADLAGALAYAHGAGFIHRDLKPANVLLGDDGRPRLTDFGLARSLHDERERLTRTGQLLGTPATMSPEQVSGDKERVGPPADVWGLGATIYEALTGEPAFRGAGLVELLAAICGGEPTPLRERRPEVPQRLEELVLSCLRREPSARPSAAELALALSGAAEPPPRRVGGGALAVTALALALAAGLAWAAWGSRTPTPASLSASPAPSTGPAPPTSPAPSPAQAALPRLRWRRLEPERTPGPRAAMAGACPGDPARGRAFLFGGQRAEEELLQDLWSFQDGAWRAREPRDPQRSLPKARRGHTLAYDPLRETLVLFGGRLTNAPGRPLLSDLWEFGPDARWENRLGTESNPRARGWHSAVWDPHRARVLVFGGFARSGRRDDLWSWDGRDWRPEPERGPTSRQSSAACTWWSRRSVALFGGLERRGPLNDLWELGRSGWVRLDPGDQRRPPARQRAGLVAEPGGGLLLYGGYRGVAQPLNDLWRWRPEEGWVELELPEGSPAPRTHAAFVELGGGRYLLCGGIDAERRYLDQTWLLTLRE